MSEISVPAHNNVLDFTRLPHPTSPFSMPMEPLPHVERFKATFLNGKTLNIPIYTRYNIRSKAHVYHYLRTTPNARGIIYMCINKWRWHGREDVSITHPYLTNPIVLEYAMDNEAVRTYLLQQLRDCLQSQQTISHL